MASHPPASKRERRRRRRRRKKKEKRKTKSLTSTGQAQHFFGGPSVAATLPQAAIRHPP
ncbi:hypothetical protein [Desulfovibrio piger]|uniref:hypothetical protein n=1 Tax=Desulfovibrio piger TaxID=901 RepID=UPI001E28DE9D|nr:hypothetical protein [Desulfovibrio piger]